MKNEKEIIYEEGYGYYKEGEDQFEEEGTPKDLQIDLQNDIDENIFFLMQKMQQLYAQACKEVDEKEIHWDIHKITMVRQELQKQLNLPDVY